MSEIRIPVSLKFDTDSDVYKDFVIELKENKELSSFIVSFLNLYYEDQEVRDLINFKREENNPYSALREQLTKINLQHSQTVMTTSMLANQTNSIIKGLEREGYIPSTNADVDVDDSVYTMNIGDTPINPSDSVQHQIEQQQRAKANPAVVDALMQRMDNMEKVLPSIVSKLEQLLSGGLVQQPTSQQPYHNVQVVQPQPVPQTQPAQPLIQPEQVHVEEQPIMMPPPQVAQPVQSELPQITIGQPEATSTQPSAPAVAIATMEEEQPTKPASFAKAFGSLKKK